MNLTARLFKIYFVSAALILSACTDKKQAPAQNKSIILDTTSRSENKYASADQSPMDMSYYPASYPLQKMKGKDSTGGPVVRVIYSRPHKKGRTIFSDSEQSLVRYGKEWRLGANEATEIEFFREVNIQGKRIPAGRFVMYCIPYPDRWTIVLNTNLYTWGLHMDPSRDFYKVDIPTMPLSPSLEDFTMVFMPAEHGTDLLMAWDNVKAILPVKF